MKGAENMKNTYTKPSAEIMIFETEEIMDILTQSGGEGILVDCSEW